MNHLKKAMHNLDINQKNDKVLIAIGVVGMVLVILLYLFVFAQSQYTKPDTIVQPIVIKHAPVVTASAFDAVTLSARSAAVWDVGNKKFIYEKNDTEVLPLASLTKLMTALAAVELLPEQSTIKIAREYIGDESDAQLFVNEHWSMQDLLAHTLITSSNAGANAIASAASAFLIKDGTANPNELFLRYINKRAMELDLSSTHFDNDSGLDLNTEKSGSYGNAKNMAILMDYILRNQPDLLKPTTHAKLKITTNDNIVHNIKNTNTSVETIPGVLGSKTGYTDLAGGNLIVAFAPGLNGPYVAVVLGSTFEDRFTDIDTLVAATLKYTVR